VIRLQKFLAQCGLGSRRACERLIEAGEISVNGEIVARQGVTIDPERDRVRVRGKELALEQRVTYLAMNKPVGVVTTMRDPQGRRTVADLIPERVPRVAPVGRLDFDTSGLLLLTNDGELAHRLTHPRFGVDKTYRAVVRGQLEADELAALSRGIRLEGFRTQAARVRVVAAGPQRSVVDITLHEGKNRQVRRMFEATGHTVIALERRAFGPLSLGNLRAGAVRVLTAREVGALRRAASKAEPPVWKSTSRSRRATS